MSICHITCHITTLMMWQPSHLLPKYMVANHYKWIQKRIKFDQDNIIILHRITMYKRIFTIFRPYKIHQGNMIQKVESSPTQKLHKVNQFKQIWFNLHFQGQPFPIWTNGVGPRSSLSFSLIQEFFLFQEFQHTNRPLLEMSLYKVVNEIMRFFGKFRIMRVNQIMWFFGKFRIMRRTKYS